MTTARPRSHGPFALPQWHSSGLIHSFVVQVALFQPVQTVQRYNRAVIIPLQTVCTGWKSATCPKKKNKKLDRCCIILCRTVTLHSTDACVSLWAYCIIYRSTMSNYVAQCTRHFKAGLYCEYTQCLGLMWHSHTRTTVNVLHNHSSARVF